MGECRGDAGETNDLQASRARIKHNSLAVAEVGWVQADADGGVPDAEYESTQTKVCPFLEGVEFPAGIPTPPPEGVCFISA